MATVTGHKNKNKGSKCEVRRKVVRKEHLAACDHVHDAILKKDSEEIKIRLKEVKHWQEQLNLLDQEIFDGQNNEEKLVEEYVEVNRHTKATFTCEVKCEEYFRNTERADNPKKKDVFQLPKLEIEPFSGAPQGWLTFWNQFRKIHEDRNISDDDKLQYLLQHTAGKVKDIVRSYPQLPENYSVVIKEIKDKFGDDSLLIRFYVKEILNLVLKNRKIELSKLYVELETKLRALKTLGVTQDRYCDLLFPLVESVLPEHLLSVWHRQENASGKSEWSSVDSKRSSLDSLLQFMKQEVESEERIRELKQLAFRSGEAVGEKKGSNNEKRVATASALLNAKKFFDFCIFCDGSNHESTNCFRVNKMPVAETKKAVLKKGVCFGCLKQGHKLEKCRSFLKCFICAGRHAPLLCDKVNVDKEKEKTQDEVKPIASCLVKQKKGVGSYLPVLSVIVKGNGKKKVVRALIDSGCQKSYVLESVAEELGLKAKGHEILSNYLFGGVIGAPKRHDIFYIDICNLDETFHFNLEVLGEKEICNFVPSLKYSAVKKFPGISFSDIDNSEALSLILGADVFGQLLTGKTKSAEGGLVALETHLGWVLTGPSSRKGSLAMFTVCLKNISLPKLWDLDVLGIRDSISVKSESQLAEEALKHFKTNLKRNEEGRYSVALPWKFDHPVLPNNRYTAEVRLRTMTEKLLRNGHFEAYEDVLEEWEKSNIIEEVPVSEMDDFGHYLPHRPVIKLSNTKTKIRPVFDASCASVGNVSLNNCLNKGPNLLEMIPPLLVKFRLGKYGIVGDIEKAFLQIEVNEADRNFLRFLWWEKEGALKKIKVFRHKRVVFGVCSSPFLLSATISNHLGEYKKEGVDTTFLKRLGSSFYVDDCVTSVNGLNEVSEFVKKSEEVMKDACFKLRGWKSNGMSADDFLDATSVLGLDWDLSRDKLFCKPPGVEKIRVKEPTKRLILSVASGVFDPIGFTAPVSLLPKLLLQGIWKQGCKWDEPLPEEFVKNFENWCGQLDCLRECRVPRWLFREEVILDRSTLHVFCDASKAAYAAAVFLRSEGGTGVNVQLVLAKNRVAPLKEVTIPRLELMSACIAVRLAETVRKAINVELDTIFWTDSRVVLAWIKRKEPWNVFVGNRVAEIRQKSNPESWRHVPGHMNPADLPSRGCSASFLLETKWWNGPEWLLQKPEYWPCEDEGISEDIVNTERKKGVCLVSVHKKGFLERLVYYFSSFSRIVRMCAFILRWRVKVKILKELKSLKGQEHRNLLRQLEELRGELMTQEVVIAEKRLLNIFQAECVNADELRALDGFKLFTDEDGLIRVRTRICQGEDPEDFQEPIILVEHELVKRLIFEKHRLLGHAGVSTTLSQLRERYFILRGRKLVRRVLNSCTVCNKMRSKPLTVPEAPLPLDRIKRVPAFQVSGVDLAGPLYLKKGGKVWVALFTCAVYRAVHLELVNSLSTEAFLMALRRFIARRGRVNTLYSDNGTNFVGANNLFKRIDWDKILAYSTIRRISWRFNPPAAPWWGGWWERMVRIVKDLLRKNLRTARVEYVELETLLCDVEATVNSRPLTYLSEDPSEPTVLTPAHFLLDLLPNSTEDLDEIDRKFLCNRIKYLQETREQIRERFRKEYLSELIYRRNKRKDLLSNLTVGDLVLLEDISKKKVFWPLGKVLELIKGRDGHSRLVRLQLQAGQVIRPLNRVHPLEMDSESKSEYPERPQQITRFGRVVKPTKILDV